MQITLVVLALLVFGCLLWVVPRRQVKRLGNLPPEEKLKLENETRKIMAEILGGACILIGLIFTWETVRSTAESLRVSQEGLLVSQKSLQVAQESQYNEQFTRAIEQLGKLDEVGKESQLAIRLGGIRGLERLAQTSEQDYWPIMDILTTHIREQARWLANPKETATDSTGPKADIAAMLNVLGNRSKSYGKGESRPLDLSGADLRRANLERFNFDNAIFRATHLENAFLKESKLNQAILTLAYLNEADLERAQLNGADLTGANLSGANLSGAALRGAVLNAANFSGATLDGAELFGVDLRSVRNLTRQQIQNAKTDHTTQLPDGL